MNIILGSEAAAKLKHNYTVLELETFKRQDNSLITAYAVVENIPLSELATVNANIQLHENFIKEFNNKNYNYCLSAVEHLMGKFNGELDSFYIEIIQRIKTL